MLVKLLEGQWVNVARIKYIEENISSKDDSFIDTEIYLPEDETFTTKERADDLAKRINSPEDVLCSTTVDQHQYSVEEGRTVGERKAIIEKKRMEAGGGD